MTIYFFFNENFSQNIHNFGHNQRDYLMNGFVASFKHDKKLTKFEILKSFLDNNFLSTCQKEVMMNYFSKTQRILYSFRRLLTSYKQKKYKFFNNNYDLYLNPLQPGTTIVLIERKIIYKFHISDLLRIIHNDLTYSEGLFNNPKNSCNPFNNLPFSKFNYYNIYLFLRDKSMTIPTLFKFYLESGFNIKLFHTNAQPLLKEESIKTFVSRAEDEDELYEVIMEMLYEYDRYLPNIMIDRSFSEKTVIETFKHLIPTYFTSKYSCYPIKKREARKNIIVFWKKFNKNNPYFGRKIFSTTQQTKFNFSNDPSNLNISFGNSNRLPFIFGENTNSINDSSIETKEDGEIEEEFSFNLSVNTSDAVNQNDISNILNSPVTPASFLFYPVENTFYDGYQDNDDLNYTGSDSDSISVCTEDE